MKVIRPIHVPGAPPLEVPGELIVNSGNAVFVPDTQPYGPHRLTIQSAAVHIGGPDDDDCVSVSGWTEVSHPTDRQFALFRKVVMEGFYPVPRT